MTVELNTLAPKKWTDDYSGVAPTIDSTNDVLIGDFAIDNSTSPWAVWRCRDNAAGAPKWDYVGLSWTRLVLTWTTAPVEQTYTGGDGQVFQYTYGSTVYYRFVPSTYDSTNDKFYTTFADPTLSGLVATRGIAV